MLPTMDFDLANQLAMYAATAGCLLIVFGVVGGFVFLVKSLFGRGRHRRSSRP